MKPKAKAPLPVTITPTDIRHGDHLRIGSNQTAIVRHVWHTGNWTYVEIDRLYYPVMIDRYSTVTVERTTEGGR